MSTTTVLRRSLSLVCWRCSWVRADVRVHSLVASVRPFSNQRQRQRAEKAAKTQASASRHTRTAPGTPSNPAKSTAQPKPPVAAAQPNHPAPAPLSTAVLSWGSGAFGGLGCSSYRPHPTPTLIPALSSLSSPVTSVSSGWTHNLAITAAGELFMWGYKPFLRSLSLTAKLHNRFPSLLTTIQSLNLGRLTLSNATTTPTPVPHFGSTLHAASTSCGGDYAAIVTADHRLFTVGSGFFGQLGRSSSIADTMTTQPREVERLREEGVRVAAVSCGFHHMLVLADDGRVYVCGKHDHGALGIGKVVKEGKRLFYPHLVPTTTQSPDALLSLAPSEERRTLSSLPTAPAYIGEVVAVSAGMKHSLLLTRDGKVYAAGHNQFGQCGFSPMDIDSTAAVPATAALSATPTSSSSFLSLSTFTRISSLKHEHIVHISAGQHHSLFVTSEGRVLACGLNQQGQCGPASPLTTTQRQSNSATAYTARSFVCVSQPQPLPLPAGFRCVRAVAGFYDSAMVGWDGRMVWCGGRMKQRVDGGGSGGQQPGSLGSVMELMGGQRVRDVSFGLVHSLLVTEQSGGISRSNLSSDEARSSNATRSERKPSNSNSTQNAGTSGRPSWY